MESQTFDRIEKKYIITAELKSRLLDEIKKHMEESNYYKSEVFNIYFDTENYDLINQSIDWVSFKHKVRARSYGGYDRVYMEIKTKNRGRDENPGNKRRIMLTRHQYKELINGGASLESLLIDKDTHNAQIAREIDYMISHLELKPKILVMYHRESYQGENRLRITFDEKLRYRDFDLSFQKKKHDKIYFKDNHNIIMEIKSQGVLPLWLANCLSLNHVYPQQFSKIGKTYIALKKEANV